MRKIGLHHLVMMMLAACSAGCMTGPSFIEHDDPTSMHEPGSDAWWAEKSMLPPGQRQRFWKGKMWPAVPRSSQPPQQFTHTFHSNHYWPLPYVCEDRQYVNQIFEMQVNRGWEAETTLYDRHFEVGGELTEAGRLQLAHIVYVFPPERRSIFIQSTHDPQMDAIRTTSVHAALSMMGPDARSVSVSVKVCQEIGRSAREVEMINSQYINSTPLPRLSGGSGTSAAGGASGGGASSGGGGGTP
ncbi:MAG: hypothetical protein KDA96_00860 [Planctomycetaceae bacterium]|nr:hypothetical protein [Planctomycetaceae bacterium]